MFRQAKFPLLNNAYKFSPSVIKDGLLPEPFKCLPFRWGPILVCQFCSPVMENESTPSSPFIGQVKKIESFHTIGVEHPLSGREAFQSKFFFRFNSVG
jgi:hypothetical protein